MTGVRFPAPLADGLCGPLTTCVCVCVSDFVLRAAECGALPPLCGVKSGAIAWADDVGVIMAQTEILPLLCIECQVVWLKTCHFGRRVTLRRKFM